MCFHLCGGRKFGLQTRDNRVHALQRQNHVTVPIEKQIDFGGPPAGDGLNLLQSRHAVDRLLERTRDGDEHLVDGHHAVVNAYDYPRKVSVGKYGHGNRESKIRAGQRHCGNQEENGPRQRMKPRNVLPGGSVRRA